MVVFVGRQIDMGRRLVNKEKDRRLPKTLLCPKRKIENE